MSSINREAQFCQDSSTDPAWHDRASNALVLRGAFLLRLGMSGVKPMQDLLSASSPFTHVFGAGTSESTTEIGEISPETTTALENLLKAAQEDTFEDGFDNTINQQLGTFLIRNPTSAMRALTSAIKTGRAKPTVAAEILKELGLFRPLAPVQTLEWILKWCLKAESPYIRDGAGLGLARLGDPAMLPYLRRAVEEEGDPQIKADLQLVIEQLTDEISNGVPISGCQ